LRASSVRRPSVSPPLGHRPNAADFKDVLKSAIRNDNPVLFFSYAEMVVNCLQATG
jgi:hypothetical protein